jgi:hypothetical protein
MKPINIAFMAIATIACLSSSLVIKAQNHKNKIQPLPRDLEIQLALSALPAHLKDSASIFLLNPNKGFELFRKGSNGFSCFVARLGDDAMRGTWTLSYRDDILYPISFDEAGVNAQMKLFFDIAELEAQGMPAETLKKLIQKRYRMHYYKPPKAGISYMLSPILCSYAFPETGDTVIAANNPHIMYYAPNVTNHDLGGQTPSFRSAYPFIIQEGVHGFSIQAVGTEERAAINKEYEGMLARLCQINPKWCISKAQQDGPAPMHHHY